MKRQLAVESLPPAKVNLFLEVLGKRHDGYHDLESIFMGVDRRDRLVIEKSEETGVRLFCDWRRDVRSSLRDVSEEHSLEVLQIPNDQRNLVVRALLAFTEAYQIRGGFDVQLEKTIPAGAGMGGASSDAAAALRAAALLCDVPLDDPQLWTIAADLGSDIPFFLGPRHLPQGTAVNSAIATGRGEKLEYFHSVRIPALVIVYPPASLSTAEVYRQCIVPGEPRSSSPCHSFLLGFPVHRGEELFFNRLLEPARKLSSWIDRTISAIASTGLCDVAMTGSGSACFALPRSVAHAKQIVRRIASRRLGVCFVARPARLPAAVRLLT